ncbi:MAG TPA: teichoic acid glycosylation protein, partial [Ruminococcaceae bacterium]|nr:teichoic acid glycosylation protein [Oscillospiraceae bacterium]
MKKLIKKYKEIILYIFFGMLTTIVNFVIYFIMNALLGEDMYLVSNVIAWIGAVAFAYVTNKIWVFESKSRESKTLLREIGEFVSARLLSLGIEETGLYIFVDLLKFSTFSFSFLRLTITGDVIAKVIMQVIVVTLNYIFSKFIIFKK